MLSVKLSVCAECTYQNVTLPSSEGRNANHENATGTTGRDTSRAADRVQREAARQRSSDAVSIALRAVKWHSLQYQDAVLIDGQLFTVCSTRGTDTLRVWDANGTLHSLTMLPSDTVRKVL